MKNTQREIRCSRVVNGNHDHSAIGASEKGAHPSRRIWPPQNDAVAFFNSASIQFAGKPVRSPRDLAIARFHRAIADTCSVGRLAAQAFEILQIIGDAVAHHKYKPKSFSSLTSREAEFCTSSCA